MVRKPGRLIHKLSVGNDLQITCGSVLVRVECLAADGSGARLAITAAKDVTIELSPNVAFPTENGKLYHNGCD